MLRAKVNYEEAYRMGCEKMFNSKTKEEFDKAFRLTLSIVDAYNNGQREFIVEFS